MSGRNWGKARDNARMRRQGTEKHNDALGPFFHLPARHPRKRVSKVTLRDQARVARKATIVVTCTGCGHVGSVPEKAIRKTIYCSQCGTVAPPAVGS